MARYGEKLTEHEIARCPVCGKSFKRVKGCRPRLYDSDRCKEKAKRKRNRDADRAAIARLSAEPGPVRVDEGDAVCHVCGVNPATRGVPAPLVCEACGVRGRAAG